MSEFGQGQKVRAGTWTQIASSSTCGRGYALSSTHAWLQKGAVVHSRILAKSRGQDLDSNNVLVGTSTRPRFFVHPRVLVKRCWQGLGLKLRPCQNVDRAALFRPPTRPFKEVRLSIHASLRKAADRTWIQIASLSDLGQGRASSSSHASL